MPSRRPGADPAPFIPSAGEETPVPTESFRLFGSKAFLRLWIAQVFSSLGDWVGLFAILGITAQLSNNSPAALSLVMGARSGRQHKGTIRNRGIESFKKFRGIKYAVGPGSSHPGALIGPAVAGLHQPQPRQAEIRHGARRRPDIFAKLRLHQHDDRPWRHDPVLGLVCSRSGHAVLLRWASAHSGGQVP